MPSLLQGFLTVKAEEEAQGHQAVRNVRFSQVKLERRQRELSPLAHDETGLTLLHWAVIYNQRLEVNKLLTANLSHIDVMTDENALLMHATPIYLAVLYRHTKTISKLMQFNPNLHLRPSEMLSSSLLFDSVKEVYAKELLDVVIAQNDPEIMALMAPLFLRDYIKERSALADYTTTYTFIGKTFSLGYSRDSKLDAATVLLNYLQGNSELSLSEIKKAYPAVTQSLLGRIGKLATLAEPVPENHKSGLCLIT